MDVQLKKGVLEYCLLSRIAQRESYGYDLLKETAEAFPSVKESTIYAILRRLRAGGLTETYEGQGSGGPVRKYYRITREGEVALVRMRANWEDLVRGVKKMCKEEDAKF